MSWSNEVILEFLELYKREQVLWDPKHPLHRNRTEVNEAWGRIQTSLSIQLPVIDLKRKKESLMTSFRMHWNKKKKYHTQYRTTWFAYNFMESFLGGKYECDSTNQMDTELYPNTRCYNSQSVVTEDKSRISSRRNEDLKHRNITNQTQINLIENRNTNDPEFPHAKNQVEATSHLKKAGQRSEPDEYDLYGQLLAKKLRKLDERQRDVAMHDIDNIMFRAKMQSAPTKSRSYSSSPSPKMRSVLSPVFIVAQQDHYVDEVGLQEHE